MQKMRTEHAKSKGMEMVFKGKIRINERFAFKSFKRLDGMRFLRYNRANTLRAQFRKG